MDFERAILCFQREFALRMLAKPGGKEYSRLSLASQAAFTIELLEHVPHAAFHPQPKVDSAIVSLSPTGDPLSEAERQISTLLFQHRKKTVRASLLDSAEALRISKASAAEIAEKSGLAKRRVFSLSRDEVRLLSTFFK
jgi:16S rRNA (adenine1518-N6/adenine1519-N6)-dimethyltransferase